jgi:hypothetical protein
MQDKRKTHQHANAAPRCINMQMQLQDASTCRCINIQAGSPRMQAIKLLEQVKARIALQGKHPVLWAPT